MAFNILTKFKPDQIKSRNLDTGFLSKYYKGIQNILIQKTHVEQTTEYFFCENYTADEHLLVFGTPTATQKMLFKAAGKGQEGFDKTKVSMGTCFILNEKGSKVLCLYPNLSLAKGKKASVMRTLKKMQRTSLKLIDEIRWLDAPLMVDSEDPSKIEQVVDPNTSNTENNQTVLVSTEEIVDKAKNLKRGIEKLVKDVMPRYKKRETTNNDAAFVKALRKAGHLFLAQLTQTDEKTRNSFTSQKKVLESGLPQWKELESRIHSQKSKAESRATLKKSLLGVVEKMNERRSEIKTILKRVNLKTLG
ncbi:hypothetical protein [Aureispira sp. CCB-QB1]|uniref:hypothetical protein n=1 Tax=Aureispira sp. CCB-QB1 TaxID=1313421 RepID=UPI000695BF07|nr:hypothetical protein [Aureispira sp. CCB-QB1]